MPKFRLASGEIREISDAELEAFLLTEEGKTAQQVDTTMGDFFTKQEKSS